MTVSSSSISLPPPAVFQTSSSSRPAIIGIQALQLGVLPRRQHPGLALPAVRPERRRHQLAPRQAGVGGQVGDQRLVVARAATAG